LSSLNRINKYYFSGNSDFLFYFTCCEKGINGNRTLAIKFRTSGNKTFSELYRYLFNSFGFIESWVVWSLFLRSREEKRLELLWVFTKPP